MKSIKDEAAEAFERRETADRKEANALQKMKKPESQDKMFGWTGLESNEDTKLRLFGRKFYGVFDGKNTVMLETEEALEEALKTIEWDDWCCVIAETKEDALKNYDAAHDQWRVFNDGTTGRPIEQVLVPLFRVDYDDHEVGSVRYQDLMTQNIVVSLIKRDPLTKEEMGFLKIQNKHLK